MLIACGIANGGYAGGLRSLTASWLTALGRYEPAKGDKRLEARPRAVALDDAQDGIFAQPDPVAYFPIRLAFGDESWHSGRVSVGPLGFLFAPRIRDLKDKRLYVLPGMSVPAELVWLVAGSIKCRVITDHWSELLRLAMSIKTGTVTASVILRKLSGYPRQNGLALALRALGELECLPNSHPPVHATVRG